MKRAIVIVLDGCGCGEAPDANDFGDFDHPFTLRHVWETCSGLNIPYLMSLGFGELIGVPPSVELNKNCGYGRLRELSMGKDSVTGHWEMMGIVTKVPFPTYPHGFPAAVIAEFEAQIGRKVLGNIPASGTEIIEKLGQEHLSSGCPIVYTSADSVFQIAAHELIVPVPKLYEWCELARAILQGKDNVERVIARPFVGEPRAFQRTGNRKDFPLEPPRNFLDSLPEPALGIGVVPELFNRRGFISNPRSKNNAEHFAALQTALSGNFKFIFANFEDFDMLYGHRNNPEGFGGALEQFDQYLGEIIRQLTAEDLLILTADHGNDPTTPSTDHSREFVPFFIWNDPSLIGPIGDRSGMFNVAEAVARHLQIDWKPNAS